MGRKLRTTVPVTLESLLPATPDRVRVKEKDRQLKLRQERNYNESHRAKDLSPLDPGNWVWVPDRTSEAEVVHQTSPRSYQVATPQGTYCQNRRALRPLPAHERERTMQTLTWNWHQPHRKQGTRQPPALHSQCNSRYVALGDSITHQSASTQAGSEQHGGGGDVVLETFCHSFLTHTPTLYACVMIHIYIVWSRYIETL